MTVVVRFAPSPTGYLHIGGARTALFNWLYARHHGGKMLLRIEDTDRLRSTDEAIQAIYRGLEWLGITWDAPPVHQFERKERHQEIVHTLLETGWAYKCYCTPEELEIMREEARAKKLPPRYDGRWRDRPSSEAPQGVDPVIRFRSPREGETLIHDLVQGEIRVPNSQLDDLVLLRADGTPTYNLSVVVDDHDMGITHVIRGDDHLTNMFRQYHIFKALEWAPPRYAHIPLIHGADGAKLSKRHGALGVESYQQMGFLPEALRNYLLRLGWSHGDDEIISTQQAIEWFDLDHVGKSSARFDFIKLTALNGHYLREEANERLVDLVIPFIEENQKITVTGEERGLLQRGMTGLKHRAKTLVELAENALFYLTPIPLKAEAINLLTEKDIVLLKVVEDCFFQVPEEEWTEANLEFRARKLADAEGIKLGKMAQPLRLALTGKTVSPSVFDIMDALGKERSLERIHETLKLASPTVS